MAKEDYKLGRKLYFKATRAVFGQAFKKMKKSEKTEAAFEKAWDDFYRGFFDAAREDAEVILDL